MKIRLEKLRQIVEKWDNGELKFTPTCPREIYDRQIPLMEGLLKVLEERAAIEGVDLTKEQSTKDFIEAVQNGCTLLSDKAYSMPPCRSLSLIGTKLVEASLWAEYELKRREQK